MLCTLGLIYDMMHISFQNFGNLLVFSPLKYEEICYCTIDVMESFDSKHSYSFHLAPFGLQLCFKILIIEFHKIQKFNKEVLKVPKGRRKVKHL